MTQELYRGLSDAQIALCEELVARAEQEWKLPIRQRSAGFLGFGKQENFYMFWVCWREGRAYFKARTVYAKRQNGMYVRFALSPENREDILAAAEHICGDYQERRTIPANVTEKRVPKRKYLWDELVNRLMAEQEKTAANGARKDEAIEEYAKELSHRAAALFDVLREGLRETRTKEIWERYVLGENETLENIGKDYCVTRERIRQLVRSGTKRMRQIFLRACVIGGKRFEDSIPPLMAFFENVGEVLIPVLDSAFADWQVRKRDVVLLVLFGEENQKTLLASLKKYKEECLRQCQAASARAVNEADLQVTRRILDMICYPTSVCADTEKEIISFPIEKETQSVATLRRRLERTAPEIALVQKPNIVYYSSSQTDHRPDFLLDMPNGRRVLVLVLPTLNMAFGYNRARIYALQRFCEENGYGYLIVDQANRSFSEIEQRRIDPALRRALGEIWMQNGGIVWADILALREKFTVTNDLIAAYVIQEELQLTLTPYFLIR